MKKCRQCGSEVGFMEKRCPRCGSDDLEDIIEGAPADRADPSGYSLKWHKFLMVVLILGGILTMISGISWIAGLVYRQTGADAADVYRYFPDLKTYDMVYGAFCLVLGVLQIYVRNRLNGFCENGPKMFMVYYLLGIAGQVLYAVTVSSVIRMNAANASLYGNVAGSIVMMIINYIYYNKRKELFVN